MTGNGSDAGRSLGEGYRYLGLGLQFAGGIVFFTLGGVALDRWLGLMPLFTIVGTLVGATLSFVNMYLKLQAFGEAEAKRKKERK
jgi:F0F1-type ATP synthase assembly protein I